eukprot:s478_g13.t1
MKGAMANSPLAGGMYHAAGEPYSADYGCLKESKLCKRWWNMPDHTEFAVATPCPCMLGAYSDLQPKVHEKMAEALAAERGQPGDEWSHSIDDRYSLGIPKVPEWQTQTDGTARVQRSEECDVALIGLPSPTSWASFFWDTPCGYFALCLQVSEVDDGLDGRCQVITLRPRLVLTNSSAADLELLLQEGRLLRLASGQSIEAHWRPTGDLESGSGATLRFRPLPSEGSLGPWSGLIPCSDSWAGTFAVAISEATSSAVPEVWTVAIAPDCGALAVSLTQGSQFVARNSTASVLSLHPGGCRHGIVGLVHMLEGATEPGWHRLLRKRRQRARAWLRKAVATPFGRKRIRRVKQVLAFLKGHHTWNTQELHPSLQEVLEMTWYCQECQLQNSQRLEFCRGCQKHWGQTWKPPKKTSRSKSRQKAQKAQTDPDRKVEKNDGDQQWNLFPSQVPWVISTPNRSSSYRIDTAHGSAEKEQQQQNDLPVPPQQAEVSSNLLSADEVKVLEHLRGLQAMNIEMPETMKSQLETLSRKEAQMVSMKMLSHSHLNRLKKVKAQAAAAAKKVASIDNEWQNFVAMTKEKFQTHALLYQQHRADLMETLNNKLEELAAVKAEVSMASQSLLKEDWTAPAIPNVPDMAQQMMEFQSVLHEGGTAEEIDLTMLEEEEDQELIEEEVPMDGATKKSSPKVPKPFRGATSPTKVANHNLKQKPDKEGKQKDDK